MTTIARRKKKSKLVGFLAVLALGLLIWTRLRLVSSLPRSVYADPGDSAGPENGAAVHADGSAAGVAAPVEPR